MAFMRWNSGSVVTEFRDLQANVMSVDCTGEYTILAGRKYLGVVNLDHPNNSLKRHPRSSKYEVGAVQWNPLSERRETFAMSSNHRAEVMSCQAGEIKPLQVLRAHTRVISDLNWSPFNSKMLATCALDNYVYIWDISDSRRPVISLCTVSGFSQVKWNKFRDDILATSHDGSVRIWDRRKSKTPVQYISAHLSKIHGLDWGPRPGQEFQLATSSQDQTVKFWDVSNPSHPQSTLSSNSPVWRARYTPFGDGLITVVVPQLRRGENSLLLWNTNNLIQPVHNFVGHTDVVLEFQWRERLDESRDHQLVTWSKDQSLRIWNIDAQLQKLCGHDVDSIDEMEQMQTGLLGMSNMSTSIEKLDTSCEAFDGTTQEVNSDALEDFPSQIGNNDSNNGALAGGGGTGRGTDRSVSGSESGDAKSHNEVLLSPIQPKTLQQEFSLLNTNIPNVRVEEMDINERTCIVYANCGKIKVRLLLTFPLSYPFNSPPSIQFWKGTTINNNIRNELSRVLKKTCQQHVRKNLSCLEPCLRQLVSTLEVCGETMDISSPYPLDLPQTFPPMKTYGSYQDANVLFPRTCGATFCGVGFLVTFMRPHHMKSLPNALDVTPRSLSALSAYTSNPVQANPPFNLMYPPVAQSPIGDPNVSISAFYYQDRRQRSRTKFRKDDPQHKAAGMGSVVVYDISAVLPIHRDLAKSYLLDGNDIPSICTHNMRAAATVGRKDLVQLWSLAALSTGPDLVEKGNGASAPMADMPWAAHPFGRKKFQALFQHYLQIGDVQTAAVLCCALTQRSALPVVPKKPCSIPDTVTHSPGGSPYHTIHHGDVMDSGQTIGAFLKSNRSSSWSEHLDNFENRHFPSILPQDPKDMQKEKHENNNAQLLDPKQSAQFEEIKRIYAEILYRWNLLVPRAEILKYSTSPEHQRGIDFLMDCPACRQEVRGSHCAQCKSCSLRCILCHLPVKGTFNVCMRCGHGGHAAHIADWFRTQTVCPAACGCSCLDDYSGMDS